MNAKQRSRLMNINRVLIFVLTVSGLCLDGLQPADLLCTLGLLVWLWLPLCTRLEAHLLNWIEDKQDQSDRHESLFPRNPTHDVSQYRSHP